MKVKLLNTFLIILGLFVFTGCSTKELNSTNYSDYLDVQALNYASDQYRVHLGIYDGSNYSWSEDQYNSIELSVTPKGLSNNYDYDNVEIEVHFYGDIPLYEIDQNGIYYGKNVIKRPTFKKSGSYKLDKTIKVKCDISGNLKSNEESHHKINLGKGKYVKKDSLKKINKDIKVTGKIKKN